MRRLARQELVEHAGEAVHVAPGIQLALAGRLLGAHVLRCSQHETGLGEPLIRRRAGRERDAEVGHHGLALVQQDVFRLDVAMDHALEVRVMQCGGDLPDEADGVVDRERPLAGEPPPQRIACDEGHDVVEQVAATRGGGHQPGVVEREDVRMVEARRDPDLAGEAVGAEQGAELWAEDLDGHLAVVLEVVGQPDGGHAAAAELALEAVAARQSGGEPGEVG